MLLYHGSNVEVKEPKLLQKQCELDFGKGFYTTASEEQAKAWALRTFKRRKYGKPCISVYEIDEKNFSSLKILKFDTPNKEWLFFVTKNRKGIDNNFEYDLVIGPVANDQTMPTLMLYLDGFYSVEETIKRLLPQKLKDQFVFKTSKALNCLKLKEIIAL